MAMTVLLASMAGVPLTAGFVGKFLAFSVAIDVGLWAAIGVAFIGAAAGFYYYFKVIRAMWVMEPGEAATIELPCGCANGIDPALRLLAPAHSLADWVLRLRGIGCFLGVAKPVGFLFTTERRRIRRPRRWF